MIQIDGEDIDTMEEAVSALNKLYHDKPWDIWLEKESYGKEVIFVEDKFDSVRYRDRLNDLTDVETFVLIGGLY